MADCHRAAHHRPDSRRAARPKAARHRAARHKARHRAARQKVARHRAARMDPACRVCARAEAARPMAWPAAVRGALWVGAAPPQRGAAVCTRAGSRPSARDRRVAARADRAAQGQPRPGAAQPVAGENRADIRPWGSHPRGSSPRDSGGPGGRIASRMAAGLAGWFAGLAGCLQGAAHSAARGILPPGRACRPLAGGVPLADFFGLRGISSKGSIGSAMACAGGHPAISAEGRPAPLFVGKIARGCPHCKRAARANWTVSMRRPASMHCRAVVWACIAGGRRIA